MRERGLVAPGTPARSSAIASYLPCQYTSPERGDCLTLDVCVYWRVERAGWTHGGTVDERLCRAVATYCAERGWSAEQFATRAFEGLLEEARAGVPELTDVPRADWEVGAARVAAQGDRVAEFMRGLNGR